MTAPAERDTPVVSYLTSALGLSFCGPRRARLLAAIDAQRVAAGLSQEDFVAAVSRPGRPRDRLLPAVTVGETYFFRDRAQCDLLQAVVLPPLVGTDEQIAIWSAGCASGEEVYTLAALAQAAGIGERCAIVGSDASGLAIEEARRAVYGPRSLRSTSAQEKAAHFQERDGLWQVSERLRRRTRFVQRNLLDGPPPPGRFQVVLCRNLLIYLTRDAVRRATEILSAALAQDGWLITAAGDPLLEAPGLQPVRTRYGLAYRRAGSPRQLARSVRAPASPGQVPASAQLPRGPGEARSSRRRPQPALAPSDRHAIHVQQLAEQVRLLGNAGRLEDACRAAIAAAQAHPLDVELRYLAGVVLLEAGRLEEAVAAASSAVYLGPQLAAAHLLLGQVEHARGNTTQARRSFRNCSRLLATAPDSDRIALAGDLPAGHLAAIAAHYLATHRADR